jgi:GNAT superfamily N-acetyltransferase
MSDINKDEFWTDLTATFEQTEEMFFEGWDTFEGRFGEYGTPGFTELVAPAKSPAMFGHDDYQDVHYIFYRDEDGKLLFISGAFYDQSNIRHPFIFMAHPDHRRQGLGTKMALYTEQKFIAEEGSKYGFTNEEFAAMPRAQRASITVPDMYKDAVVSEAAASFLNKTVNTFFTE